MSKRRRAFTLIELLVVMVIIGLLLALLLPAVQAARESARAASCRNNLRQIAVAVANYENGRRTLPPSWLPTSPDASGNINGWSAHALLLPYLEQKATASEINYQLPYTNVTVVGTADGRTLPISALRVPTYLCPSEVRDETRFDGAGDPEHYPLNYAFNAGTWFVWDPATGRGGDGAFYPNSELSGGDFLDGMSYTVMAAEVKGWNSYYRNAALSSPAIPTLSSICGLGGTHKTNSGHTEWVDGRVHQIGFTSVFKPNTQVPCAESGVTYDVDWTNQQEGKSGTVETYAAVTSRSYHEGFVNVSMMDGSVQTIDDRLEQSVWRALCTRRGEEILSDSWAP